MAKQLLIGIHDREGAHLVPTGGWCLDTIALSDNPAPTDYGALAPGRLLVVRANWGYGQVGTLPAPDQYGEYAARLARYVAHSRGCSRWIVGNEPNLRREWPGGVPIYPAQYAECYVRARAAVRSVAGHEQDEVLVAAVGPWNAELRYAGNDNGDWVQYFADVIQAVGEQADGFALHAYTHGYDPALVRSETRMQPPFTNRYYEFRTYRDFLAAIPTPLRDRPVYITEANGNGPWQARGLMPAMLREIDQWNQHGSPQVRCVIFYRYPRYDEYAIEGKADVVAEFEQAAASSPPSPLAAQAQPPQTGGSTVYMPIVSREAVQPPVTAPPRQWDARLDLPADRPRARLVAAQPKQGQTYWRLVETRWFDEREAQGKVNVFVEVLDEAGQRVVGVPVEWTWADGREVKRSEAKPGHDYALNFDMYSVAPSYSVRICDSAPSDCVEGLGLGNIEQPAYTIHTAYRLVFQRTQAGQDTSPVTSPLRPGVPALVHPVADARYRAVTQPFGVNEEYYRRFAVDGVPLRGHNGLDFGTPTGTAIRAVAAGRAVEVANDASGYGLYVKLSHPWGESLYAHLSRQDVAVGQQVQAGQRLGLSGNSGNATGPHLHFGLRVAPFNRRDGWGGYSDPQPYLEATAPQVAPADAPDPSQHRDLVAEIYAATREFGVDPYLFVSLVYAESHFDPTATSPAGAMGLAQLMPLTWREWRARVGQAATLTAWRTTCAQARPICAGA